MYRFDIAHQATGHLTSLADIPEDFRGVKYIHVYCSDYETAKTLASRFPKYCKAQVWGCDRYGGTVVKDDTPADWMETFRVDFGWFGMQDQNGVTGVRNETGEKRFLKVVAILKSL